MLSSTFVEDIFLRFYSLVQNGQVSVQHQDFSPILSFHNKVEDNEELTQNQRNYIVKLLEKYKNLSAMTGYDYNAELASAAWKSKLRVLDLSKKIYVEETEGKLWVCLRFPFQLKKQFEQEIGISELASLKMSHWDHEERVRKLSFYDCNLIQIYEFVQQNNFEIDDSFMIALSAVEEIWQNADDVVPYSELTNTGVQLRNASAETLDWWNSHYTEGVPADLLTAKSMGFPLRKTPVNLVEKIASSTENTFWLKTNAELFSLCNAVTGKVCIILDRTSNTLQWLQNFVADADKSGVSRDEIKVCFRDNKDSKTGINDWIKAAGVGGKVEDGKILIFESKPAKWLFKDQNDVKLLVTNNIYPLTNIMTRDWFSSHHCALYLGDIKPSEQRGQKIVEL